MSNWEALKKAYNSYEEMLQKEINEGKNNYCLLNTVLRANDEVRLHSRFIASLLDTKAKHFKKDFFLSHLLAQLPKKFHFPSSAEVEVKLEVATGKVQNYPTQNQGFIDIYISDGYKHWLIENKLDAGDQHRQMARYIDWFLSRYGEDVSWEDITFVYLTNGRNLPSPESRGRFSIVADRIENEDGEAVCRYLPLHYRTHIQEWISLCIKNLAEADPMRFHLDDYKTALKRYLKEESNKVISLAQHLEKEENQVKCLDMLAQVDEELPKLKVTWLTTFFHEVEVLLEELSSVESNETMVPKAEPLKFTQRKEKVVYCDNRAALFFTGNKAKGKDNGSFYKLPDTFRIQLDLESDLYIMLIYGIGAMHIGLCTKGPVSSTFQAIESRAGLCHRKGWSTKTSMYFTSESLPISKMIWQLGKEPKNTQLWTTLTKLVKCLKGENND